jgi:16S rRNA processing protein RimM
MGRILGPFGVQGWVKVKTFTEQPGALGAHSRWLVETKDGWRERSLQGFEVHARGPVAKLEGCDDRTVAQQLQGCDVAVLRADLGEAGEGSIFWVDLVGLEVVDGSGKALGRVEGLFESGETSVLVVGRDGGPERLIPFVPEYVKAVDRGAGRITVEWKPDYDA